MHRTATTPVDGGLRRAFRAAASWRGARAFHPRGVTLAAEAHLTEVGRPLATEPSPGALVRFSRGAGLPSRFPDVNGVAIRLLDAAGPARHRDLLLSSVGPGPLRVLPFPSIDFGRSRLSSLAPFDLLGRRVVLRASVELGGGPLDDLAGASGVVLVLDAHERGKRPQRLATLTTTGSAVGEPLRFSPLAPDDVLVPTGWLNRLRPAAYEGSQFGRAGSGG